ncbi:MAG TPA: hypothetical protein VKQ72_12210, partial [Aggregatilineales bacterium]|nr:hypothetical protein [Aggregatilineales bacterium]
RLKKPCVQCGQLLDLPWNLCPFCAAPQAALEPEPVNSQRPSARRSAAARSGYQPLAQSSVEFVDGEDV